MTILDTDRTSQSDPLEYRGPEPPESEGNNTALCEFAEEAQLSPRAWSRSAFVGALGRSVPEKVQEDAPVILVVDIGSPGRWIPIATGLAACLAIGALIALTTSSPTPTESSSTVPARAVPFVSTPPPYLPSHAGPGLAAVPSDRSATLPGLNPVATATPAQVKVMQSRPEETPAPISAAPPLFVSVAPLVPSVPRATLAPPPVTEPALRSPEPAAPAATAIEREEREIRNLLDAYRDSYDRRDVISTAKIWPSVDTSALSRAFSTIASQQIDFHQCSLNVIGQRANAHCTGSLQYIRRIGNDRPRSRQLSWDFELDRSTGRWLIDRVTAR